MIGLCDSWITLSPSDCGTTFCNALSRRNMRIKYTFWSKLKCGVGEAMFFAYSHHSLCFAFSRVKSSRDIGCTGCFSFPFWSSLWLSPSCVSSSVVGSRSSSIANAV